MWDIKPLDNFKTETKYKHLGRPKKIALPSDLWRQGELVKPVQVPVDFSDSLSWWLQYGGQSRH